MKITIKRVCFEFPLPQLIRGTKLSTDRRQKEVKHIFFLALSLILLLSSCKTKEVPGRRRTPRHCNTCTKWSYLPQETIEYELLHNDES